MTHLDIIVEDNLSTLRFESDDKVLGVIDSPRLLWECSCNPLTGGRSPAQGPCRLHSLPQAELISQAFGDCTTIWYRGIPTRWDSSASWPPSVDAWYFIKTLIDLNWPSEEITGIWDIGAGTGFLGMHLANASLNLKKIHAVEIMESAAELCEFNLEKNLEKRVGWEVISCDARELDRSAVQTSEAIISAPPYIPHPPWVNIDESIHQDAARGLELLRFVMRLAKSTQVPLALLYSSVAGPEVDEMLDALQMKSRVLSSYSVPLRVNLSSEHTDWLIKDGRIELRKDDVFAYWHSIRVALQESKE